MQEGPILLEENITKSEWIDKVKPFIINRINLYANNEIKFNLLAVIPDRRAKLLNDEKELIHKKNYLNKLLGNNNINDFSDSENANVYNNFK